MKIIRQFVVYKKSKVNIDATKISNNNFTGFCSSKLNFYLSLCAVKHSFFLLLPKIYRRVVINIIFHGNAKY